MKSRSLIVPVLAACLVMVSAALAMASVEKNPDGTYTVSGTWTFWADKDLLAPSGKSNDFGKFGMVLFKSSVNDTPGLRSYKSTFATFKIRGRESAAGGASPNLVVEEILEVIEGGAPGGGGER